jgi:eukaryotic-like serine/threonine-protein kinase
MEKVGKYKILGKLGQGGMGVVYKALDPLLERIVALKTINSNFDSEPDLRVRFFREGRSAASLSHKNIITIYDLGEDNGMAYMAMEFLEGEDLRRKIHEGKLRSLDEKLAVMMELCEGLAHAHSRGIIHRDIKPANVFITDSGLVKILDFGLARMANSELTRSGAAIGSPSYMSPEQVLGETVDRRTDVFSAGALFYELLTYHKPFDANSVPATIVKILQEEPEPIERVAPSVDPGLVEIVRRALAKDVRARYQDVELMLRDLRVFSTQSRGTPWVVSRTEPEIDDGGTPLRESTSSDNPTLAHAVFETPADLSRSRSGETAPTQSTTASRHRTRPAYYAAAASLLLAVAAIATYWNWRQGSADTVRAQTSDSKPTSRPVPSTTESNPVNPLPRSGEAAVNPVPAPGSQSESIISPDPRPPAAIDRVPGKAETSTEPSRERTRIVAQGNASARSLMSRGRYEEAAARVGEVLGVSPGDAEALRLAAQLNAYAQKNAMEALNQMTQSKRKAEDVSAAKYAPKSLEAAAGIEQEARRLYDERRYGEAVVKFYSAGGLYVGAAVEAEAEKSAEEKRASLQEEARNRSIARQQAESSRASFEQERLDAVKADTEARVPQRYQEALRLASEAQARLGEEDFAGAKAGFDKASAAMRQARAAAQELARASASPAVESSPKGTVPSSPAAIPEDAARNAISAVLQQYIASLQSKDLQKLHDIWPGLGGQQEKALRDQFSAARQIQAKFGDIDLKITGDTATATARRTLSLLTVDGQRPQSEDRTTVHLRRVGRSWLIDRIVFEPIR